MDGNIFMSNVFQKEQGAAEQLRTASKEQRAQSSVVRCPIRLEAAFIFIFLIF